MAEVVWISLFALAKILLTFIPANPIAADSTTGMPNPMARRRPMLDFDKSNMSFFSIPNPIGQDRFESHFSFSGELQPSFSGNRILTLALPSIDRGNVHIDRGTLIEEVSLFYVTNPINPENK